MAQSVPIYNEGHKPVNQGAVAITIVYYSSIPLLVLHRALEEKWVIRRGIEVELLQQSLFNVREKVVHERQQGSRLADPDKAILHIGSYKQSNYTWTAGIINS